MRPGRVAQSVGHLTRRSGVLGSIPGLATYFVSPSAFSKRAVVSYWRKYVHDALVNRLEGLSLPRKSVVRLTDRPDMTLAVYHGRKTTMQQQQYTYEHSKFHDQLGWFNIDFIWLFLASEILFNYITITCITKNYHDFSIN